MESGRINTPLDIMVQAADTGICSPDDAAFLARNHEFLASCEPRAAGRYLTAMLMGNHAGYLLREFPDAFSALLPEVQPMMGFLQHNPHHIKDVWGHTALVVAAAKKDPVLRWAALLHDIGKPHCFSFDDEGIGHFYKHPSISAGISSRILRRLGFAEEFSERVLLLVKHHDTPLPTDQKGLKRLLNRFGEDTVLQLIDLHRADTAGLAPEYHTRFREFDSIENSFQTLVAEMSNFSVKDLAIDGNDLLAMGLKGREIGCTLSHLTREVSEGRLQNTREDLLPFVNEKQKGTV